MPKTIIISDLDGTLLDSANYSYAAALPSLGMIRARDVPLILCSSKTRAEIEVIRRQLHNNHPFVTENGGGIFVPHGYFSGLPDAPDMPDTVESGGYRLVALGTPYAEIRKRFVRLREQLGIKVRGFADMTAEEIAALTGLSRDDAVLAGQRDFDEPFVFEGAPDERFLQAIEADGLNWTQGRIFHIMGRHDKGRAVSLLKSLYEKQFGAVVSIGLGDSLNDLQMLQAVDRPVLVRHEDGSHDARIAIVGLLKTQLPGPTGWNETVLQLLAAKQDVADALIEIFNAALTAVDPYRAVLRFAEVKENCLRVEDASYDLTAFDRIVVVGAGKATARMAQAVEALLGERISAGLIIVKQGHTAPLEIIEQAEAAHPVPDEAGEAGAKRILEMVRAAGEKTLLVCLLSGGASALLVAPAEGVTLRDKQEATALLLRAGASIDELNAVRKHLSAVKGGRLAQAACPATVVTLLLSDVIGDRLDVIASGPTAPDGSTFADALAVIVKYRLAEKMPPHVSDYLQWGADGQVAETVKVGDRCLDRTRNVIVGAIGLALDAAAEKSRQLGLPAKIIGAELRGEARAAAAFLAQAARDTLAGMRDGERCCRLSGGETTVVVGGTGKGGRNQELALAFALEVEGLAGVSLLSAATDGNDGPTDAAGALVDGRTAARARGLGIDPALFLENNDSYSFFQRLDELSGGNYPGGELSGAQSHFITGPTGTNVMDMQVLLLEKTGAR
ncbi:MAG: HAD-IIB family hydrolase [Gallionella sp.]|nr:HAD-IIB family hydrolase [Gallionella sp.]